MFEQVTHNQNKISNKQKLIAMMIVRNESRRYLRECLDHLNQYVDEMVIIDDASTDDTPEICKYYDKAFVIELKESLFENEVELRRLAWNETVKRNPDWILTVDADEVYEDAMIHQVKEMIHSCEYDAYAFRLYDFWNSRETYREDKNWQAHHFYKTFLVRNVGLEAEWLDTPKHCGRIPLNYSKTLRTYYSDIRVKHLGWMDPVDQLKKYDYYLEKDPVGKYGSLDQYKSIVAPNPNLIEWKEEICHHPKVLIGSTVHQSPEILAEFIHSLMNLDTNGLDAHYLFIDDNTENVSRGLLELFSRKTEKTTLQIIPQEETRKEKDTLDKNWNWNKEFRVAEMKNMILAHARQMKADYVFLIDADILVHTRTLKHLIACDKPLLSEIVWDDRTGDPQVWMYDNKLRYWIGNYENKEDIDSESRKSQILDALMLPGIMQVGGVGACTLIRKDALSMPIHFHRIPNISFDSEDVHFSIRASSLGIPLYVDTVCPALHLHHYQKQKDILSEYKIEAGITKKVLLETG